MFQNCTVCRGRRDSNIGDHVDRATLMRLTDATIIALRSPGDVEDLSRIPWHVEPASATRLALLVVGSRLEQGFQVLKEPGPLTFDERDDGFLEFLPVGVVEPIYVVSADTQPVSRPLTPLALGIDPQSPVRSKGFVERRLTHNLCFSEEFLVPGCDRALRLFNKPPSLLQLLILEHGVTEIVECTDLLRKGCARKSACAESEVVRIA